MDSPQTQQVRDRERRKKQKNSGQLAWKWNLYLFASSWKNGSDFSPLVKGIFFFLQFLVTIFPSFYTILEYLDFNANRVTDEHGMFPASRVLSFITPQVLPTAAFAWIFFVLEGIFIVVFVTCLKSSPKSFKYISILGKTHLMDARVHMVLLPFATGVMRYYIGILLEWNQKNVVDLIMGLVYFIFFACYTGGCCVLHFMEATSLVKPDIFCEGWFDSAAGFMPPLISVFTSMMGLGALHWGYGGGITCLCIGFVLCSYLCVYTVLKVPKMMFLTNDLLATRYATSAYGFLISLIMVVTEAEYGVPMLYTIPLVSMGLFVVIHVISQILRKRRRKLYIEQIENAEHMTIDTLTETLKTVRNIGDYKLIVKEGLASGCKAVQQPMFVRYCLEKFKESEWFLCYAMFLYGTVWGADSEAYRLMLHLISIDEFGFSVEFVVFQLVFNLMQTSNAISPVIDRNLNCYHEDMREYLEAHQSFWQAAVRQNDKLFEKSFAQMVHSYIAMEKRLTSLAIAFDYSPVVHCERSIFFADFCHDLEQGSVEYHKTMLLRNGKQQSVSRNLLLEFSAFFHLAGSCEQNIHDDDDNDYYYYWSITEHDYDSNSEPYPEAVALQYNFMGIPKVFRIHKNKPRTAPIVARSQIEWLRAMTWVSFLLFIACFVCEHFLTGPTEKNYMKYVVLRDAVHNTLEFKNHMMKARIDFGILYNIITEKWDSDDTTEFYSYVRSHLLRSSPYIAMFANLVDQLKNEGVSAPVSDKCTTQSCTFSSSIAMMSWVCDYFGRVNAKSQIGGDPVATLEEIDIMYDNVMKFSTIYYDTLYRKIYGNIDAEIHNYRAMTISLVVVEIVGAIATSCITYLLANRTKGVIFDIIRTAQPPIMGYIATVYNHVIGNEEKSTIRNRKLPNMSIWFFLMFFVLAIYPLALMVWSCTLPKVPTTPSTLPHDISISSDTDFMLYKLAQNEFYLIERNLMKDGAIACYHDIINCDYSTVEVSYTRYDDLLFGLMYFGQTIIMLTATILSIVALSKAAELNRMVNVGLYQLRYFPGSAVQSNPVFKKLLLGESLTTKETNEFTKNINEGVQQLIDELGCYELFFDDTEKITDGNMDPIMGSTPKTLAGLQEMLMRNCHYDSHKAKLTAFMNSRTSREKKPVTMSLDNKKEITLRYGVDCKSIVIKDDAEHLDDNEVRNMEVWDRLSGIVKQIADQEKADPYTKAVLIIVDYRDAPESILQELTGEKEALRNFTIVDTRKRFLVLIGKADRSAGLICEEAMNYAQSLRGKPVKCIVHFGGPVSFYKSADVTKPRCFGAAYDTAKLLVLSIPAGTIAATKLVFDQAARTPEGECQYIPLADGKSITVVSL